MAYNVSSPDFKNSSLIASIGDGTNVITTGIKHRFSVPWGYTIKSVVLIADQSGSIVIDIKKSTYANFPTTASICAAAIPTLSAAQKSSDATLTGWTTSIAAGDVLELVVNSVSTVTYVALTLKLLKA